MPTAISFKTRPAAISTDFDALTTTIFSAVAHQLASMSNVSPDMSLDVDVVVDGRDLVASIRQFAGGLQGVTIVGLWSTGSDFFIARLGNDGHWSLDQTIYTIDEMPNEDDIYAVDLLGVAPTLP